MWDKNSFLNAHVHTCPCGNFFKIACFIYVLDPWWRLNNVRRDQYPILRIFFQSTDGQLKNIKSQTEYVKCN